MLSAFVLLAGCKGNGNEALTSKVMKLEEKVSKLEKLTVNLSSSLSNSKNEKSTKFFIKSITFRIDSKDDRLRIYWSDGSKTDLPCSKDEATWACG